MFKLDPTTGEVTVFNHDPKDETSISADLKSGANIFIKDSLGNMWSHHGKGLNLINPTTNKITRFLRSKSGGSISSDTINTLLPDKFGNMWIGTNKGLDRMDINTKTFEYMCT